MQKSTGGAPSASFTAAALAGRRDDADAHERLPRPPRSGDDAPLTDRERDFADAVIDRIIEQWQAEQRRKDDAA